MRPDLYTAGSEYHRKRRWTHEHSLRCLDMAFDVLGGLPVSLLDVGCAEGVHVLRALELGIEAQGVDMAAPEHAALTRADLREPLDLGRRFDWVLCWEVAEHLPQAAAGTLCDTIARHVEPGGRVLFTAARPGQKGPGHINCQPAVYWDLHFMERGLTYAEAPTEALRAAWLECSPKTPWYGRNVSVYWRSA